MTITVNTQKKIKKMNPVHGIGNGPLPDSMADLSKQYKEAGFPVARLHDTHYPFAVDIAHIFRNFNADENDPANYSFTNTDKYIKSMIDLNMDIIYRLGPSIEHTPEKRYISVPSDYTKWAKICVNIIKHYNEGWADGFNYGIKYWEIWNEPNLPDGHNWSGTLEEYCNLYITAATYIKEQCPNICIGGPTASSIMASDFINMFLSSVKKANAPLDFFSWHKYDQDPEIYRHWVQQSKAYLKNNGFENVLMVCDEWNFHNNINTQGYYVIGENVQEKADYYNSMKNMFGASFVAGTLSIFQQEGLDIGAYYDGQTTNYWCGVFDFFGVPQKTFYTFKAFNTLYRLGTEVETICPKFENSKYTYALAATDGNKTNILLSRHLGESEFVDVEIKGLRDGKKKAEIYLLNDENDLAKIRTEIYNGNDVVQTLYLERNSVILIEITEE